MTETSFSKNKIGESVLGPYENHCVGYPGQGNYLVALVIGIGSFEKSFSHSGSDILDRILAYDRAEVSEAYLGQINMSIVSSFCGPEGLIWGYDLAKKEDISLPAFLPSFFSKEAIEEFKGIKIKNGENLRKAAAALFGTVQEKHFPFLPGSHVPCAGRFYTKSGPTILYGVIAIGIPENRKKAACLLMEDVGEITASEGIIVPIKEKLMFNAIKSVIEVGKNQKVRYREIFVDFVAKEIASQEIGCVLIAMPYFLLPKKAFTNRLVEQNLKEWVESTREYFLCNQYS